MKAGIGITTRNRAKLLEITLSYISANWPDFDTKLVVSDDSTEADVVAQNRLLAVKYGAEYVNNGIRKGVAGNKNQCLSSLMECEYIVLFDDDCFPIKKGWLDFLIEAHKETDIHHFNMLDSKLHYENNRRNTGKFTVIECVNSGGVMMFITNEVLKKVGAFNKQYGLYGFEHCSYSRRVERSGLQNGFSANCTLDGIYSYLFSLDYGQFEVNPGHHFFNEFVKDIDDKTIFHSSMNKDELHASISANSSIYSSDVSGPIFQEI